MEFSESTLDTLLSSIESVKAVRLSTFPPSFHFSLTLSVESRPTAARAREARDGEEKSDGGAEDESAQICLVFEGWDVAGVSNYPILFSVFFFFFS